METTTARRRLELVRTPSPGRVADAHAENASEGDRRDDAHAAGRVAAGDADALEALYERYGRVVHALAYRITGDGGLAEECTQDVFVTLWRRAGDFDPSRAKLTTWLLTIARNRAVEMVRHRSRRPRLHDGEGPVLELVPDENATDPASAVTEADRAARVAEAMAELPSEQLQVVNLAYFDGLSQTEIAEAIGVPLGTVKGRTRLALDRLRRVVDDYDLTPEAA